MFEARIPRRPWWRVWLKRSAGLVLGLLAGAAIGFAVGAGGLGDPGRPAASAGGPHPDEGRDRGSAERRPARALRRDLRAAEITPLADEPLAVTLDDAPEAGILIDVGTGETLWRQNVREPRSIASLTKIMTALVVVDELREPGRRVQIGVEAAGAAGAGDVSGSAIGLEEGMRVKVAALFQSMLIASHNDAATALAIQVAGSEERFVASMNRRAETLGLDCTRFASAHGFEAGNRSCALDLAAITRLAIGERRIREVARRERAVVDFPADGGQRYLYTTNPLIEMDYPGTIGLKTGYTEHAGRSLAAVVRRDGRTFAAILLDSPNPESQARLLLDAAFRRSGAKNAASRSLPPARARTAAR